LGATGQEQDERENIWSHLDELAGRAKIAVIAVFVATGVVSIFPVGQDSTGRWMLLVPFIITKVRSDLLPNDVTLIPGTWIDVLTIYFMMALVLGLIIASPVLGYEVYRFVNPALYPHERRAFAWFVGPFVFLLLFGAVFSYFLILPITFRVLIEFVKVLELEPIFTAADFYSFILLVMLSVGLMFTFPVFTSLLIRAGVFGAKDLASRRREVILGLLILTAIITPDTTGVTMAMLFVPLAFLFEIAILVGRRIERTRERTEALEQATL
jgi:sec-independent protein translocase protein TatC